MNGTAQQPLPEALSDDLELAARSAVSRRDLPALEALHGLGVNLERALAKAARNGYHEITRGLRRINIPASELAVMFAVERSEQSYWSLAEPDGVPPYPKVALEQAVLCFRWTLAQKLLKQYRVQSTVRAVGHLQIETVRHRPPAECVRALIDHLPDHELCERVLRVAAALLDTPRLETACSRAPGVSLQALLVPAFRAGNTANFYALLHAGAVLEGSLVAAYFSPPRLADEQQERRAIAFIETLGVHLGPVLSLADLTPAFWSFLLNRAAHQRVADAVPPIGAHALSERWASAIVSALDPVECAQIGVLLERLVAELRGWTGQAYSSGRQLSLLGQFNELFNQQVANRTAPTEGLSP